MTALINFATQKRIAWRDIAKVATVDSMQGHEAKYVILDWVVVSQILVIYDTTDS